MLVLVPWLVLLFVKLVTTLQSVFGCILLELDSEIADNSLVTAVSKFELGHGGRLCLELKQRVEAGGLFLNGVSHRLEAPLLFIDNLGAGGGEKALELFDRFLHLLVRQNGSHNENGLVLIHHRVNELIGIVVKSFCQIGIAPFPPPAFMQTTWLEYAFFRFCGAKVRIIFKPASFFCH